MRKLFSRQLIEARHEMLSIYEAVDLSLHDAVNAFIANDKDLGKKAQRAADHVDARSANLEAVCYNLIATQSPVASDFRLLQTDHLRELQPPAHERQGPLYRTCRASQGRSGN